MSEALVPIFDVIVVGYNSPVLASPSVTMAQKSPLVRAVFYCDNSTEPVIRAQNQNASPEKVVYIDVGGNHGISRAYNVAIKRVRAPYVVLFDDDTAVSEGFFEGAATWALGSESGVFVPVVTVDGHAFSPCRRILGTFRPVGNLSRIPIDFSAINSGMVISVDVFADYRYDERLFLEFVDHKFVSDTRSRGIGVTVMSNVVLEQSFSAVHDDCDAAYSRHEIFRRDSAVYYSGLSGRAVRWVRLGLRLVKLARMGIRR